MLHLLDLCVFVNIGYFWLVAYRCEEKPWAENDATEVFEFWSHPTCFGYCSFLRKISRIPVTHPLPIGEKVVSFILAKSKFCRTYVLYCGRLGSKFIWEEIPRKRVGCVFVCCAMSRWTSKFNFAESMVYWWLECVLFLSLIGSRRSW